MLKFTGERIVPGADNCEKLFARKMYQEHIARYLFASQFVGGRDVLDVGCGVGYGSHWLARQGAARHPSSGSIDRRHRVRTPKLQPSRHRVCLRQRGNLRVEATI